MSYEIPTVGVEEEYQLVHPSDGTLLSNCKEVMATLRRRGASRLTQSDIHHELYLSQIEMASSVCQSLEEVQIALQKTRELLSQAARENDCRLAAAGTNPFPFADVRKLTPSDRYRAMTQQYQQIARDLMIFGCHVHVAMEDRNLGVQVMNRCQRWLPVLQALTANSPYWDGADTGYASFRRELWAQWPMAGPPSRFDDLKGYESCVADLIRCGAIKDESYIYWDIRLPTKVPTIEFRAADVMTRIEETVGYVGLVRAMVMQAIFDERAGEPMQRVRSKVLSYSIWHAARYGTTQALIDPVTCEQVSASDMIDRVIEAHSAALRASGDRDAVDRFVQIVSSEGTGADRQRRSAGEARGMRDVVSQVVDETAPS